jgi:antitoxin (DNA-binding transcriptional repressor) of toxin-antitoxin stability system
MEPESPSVQARSFYRERLAEAFHCSRRLSAPLGAVAETVVEGGDFAVILRECAVGSLECARRIGELAVVHLDRVPVSSLKSSMMESTDTRAWWRDLLNYERGWFLQAATTAESPPANRPRRGVSAVCMNFSWAVPELMERIREGQEITVTSRQPVTVLFARGAGGRVTAVEAGPTVEKVFRATNGLRTLEQIAQTAGFDPAETQEVLGALAGIGAIVPAMPAEAMLRSIQSRESR